MNRENTEKRGKRKEKRGKRKEERGEAEASPATTPPACAERLSGTDSRHLRGLGMTTKLLPLSSFLFSLFSFLRDSLFPPFSPVQILNFLLLN